MFVAFFRVEITRSRPVKFDFKANHLKPSTNLDVGFTLILCHIKRCNFEDAILRTRWKPTKPAMRMALKYNT